MRHQAAVIPCMHKTLFIVHPGFVYHCMMSQCFAILNFYRTLQIFCGKRCVFEAFACYHSFLNCFLLIISNLSQIRISGQINDIKI